MRPEPPVKFSLGSPSSHWNEPRLRSALPNKKGKSSAAFFFFARGLALHGVGVCGAGHRWEGPLSISSGVGGRRACLGPCFFGGERSPIRRSDAGRNGSRPLLISPATFVASASV